MINVQIVLFDGFDLMDAIAPYEVFHAAAMEAMGSLSVELVTAEGPRAVPSGVNGLNIEATGTLNPERPGIILVPGAAGDVEGDGPDSVPAILARATNTVLTGLIGQALEQEDIVVATVCGGSLALAMGGLLEGRPAVTHHLGMDVLGATGAVPVQARVVDDGNLVTGGGVTSGLDVALYLVEREIGPKIALAVERLFDYERRGTVWRNTGLATAREIVRENDELEITSGTWTEAGTGAGTDPVLETVRLDQGGTQASDFDGDWDTNIATPVGNMQVKLSIVTRGGMIRGRAIQGDETIEMLNPVLQDNRLSWSLRITKPMRLNLKFEVTAEGDHMVGVAKAGILPASKLTGTRVAPR